MDHLPPDRMMQERHRRGDGDRVGGALGGQVALIASHGSRTDLVLAAVHVKNLRIINLGTKCATFISFRQLHFNFLRRMDLRVDFNFPSSLVAFASHLLDVITSNLEIYNTINTLTFLIILLSKAFEMIMKKTR